MITTHKLRPQGESPLGSDSCSVLFLDVDGVLNRCGKSAQGLETDKVEMLARIVSEANPIIVVSSTWRIFDRGMNRLHLIFAEMGARFGGITPYHNDKTEGGIYTAKSRGNEIQEWLDDNGTPDRFVILDDDSDMGHLLPHLVKTESFVGLTPEITQRVIDALNVIGHTRRGWKPEINLGRCPPSYALDCCASYLHWIPCRSRKPIS